MIRGLLILLLCQFAGEVIARAAGIPVPGGVIGMLLLFAGLLIRRGVPDDLEQVSQTVLKPLTLYFVPASVGIMTMGPLLAQEGLRIGLVLLLSTLLPLLVCGYGLDRWLQKRGGA
ncbi:MAG: CidA/LrgA family protein [Moraxellaceae bacterium]|nr:CidA/LrgA family protein [Moraxellaceae bacterium]